MKNRQRGIDDELGVYKMADNDRASAQQRELYREGYVLYSELPIETSCFRLPKTSKNEKKNAFEERDLPVPYSYSCGSERKEIFPLPPRTVRTK